MSIFLRKPPENVKEWQRDCFLKSTKLTLSDGDVKLHLIEGELDQESLAAAGAYDLAQQRWLADPVAVRVGQAVQKIGYSFSGCTALRSVLLPSTPLEIGPFAFSACGMLSSVELPAGVVSVGEMAFSGCGSLARVEVGEGCQESIGADAFASCPSLSSVVFYGCESVEQLKELPGYPWGIQDEDVFNIASR